MLFESLKHVEFTKLIGATRPEELQNLQRLSTGGGEEDASIFLDMQNPAQSYCRCSLAYFRPAKVRPRSWLSYELESTSSL